MIFYVSYVKLKDDRIILDKTLADQVSSWKSSRGLSDAVVTDHACSGETCSYYQIGDVFICEKTGHVHGGKLDLSFLFYALIAQSSFLFYFKFLKPGLEFILCVFLFPVCDDTCREVVMDPTNELLVCTISGHCFDRLLSPSEMEPDVSQNVL